MRHTRTLFEHLATMVQPHLRVGGRGPGAAAAARAGGVTLRCACGVGWGAHIRIRTHTEGLQHLQQAAAPAAQVRVSA